MRTRRLLWLIPLLAACASRPSNQIFDADVVTVVDEHHEALLVLARLPEGRRHLVHLDSHADLGVPDALPAPLARAGLDCLVADELAVDELVAPAVLLGFVDAMVWVVPAPVAQRERDERYEVGTVGGRGRRMTLGARLDELLFPDRTAFDVRVRRIANVRAPTGPWILDIDLDYFACANPHAEHLDRPIDAADAHALLSAARVLDRGAAKRADGVLVESTVFEDPDGGPWPRRLDRVENVWTYGWRCLGASGAGLPVHSPTDAELDASVEALVRWLRSVGRAPDAVVLARSARSGFVPPERVDEIQSRVLGALRELGLRQSDFLLR